MGRIRTIKPEFPQSESMGKVCREARLLFILTWTLADDSGRLRGDSRMLASLLFPYDDDVPKKIEGWLSELVTEHCIIRYHADDSSYIQINKWLSHQKIDKPTPSKIPPFDEESRGVAEDSRSVVGGLDLDQGPRTKEGTAPSASVLRPESVPVDVWEAFLSVRKAKRSPLTEIAMKGLMREATKAGWTLEKAIRECAERGWQSFKADWVASKASPFANKQSAHIPNMPLGAPACSCSECDAYREKRRVAQ